MNANLQALAAAALEATNGGRWSDAEQLWQRVLAQSPDHAQAHFHLGLGAYRRGDLAGAEGHLEAAADAAAGDPLIALTVARVKRDAGDAAGELRWIERALAIDPYRLPALLAKGEHHERQGDLKAAARAYGPALQVAGAEAAWPAALRERLMHARALLDRFSEQFAQFLARSIGDRVARLPVECAGRWHEAAAVLSGRSPLYPSMASQLQVPRLPAIPFYERTHFPWAEALEAQTDAIREELRALLAAGRPDFAPYIQIADGLPVNQWQELNRSERWSSYFLWQHGEPVIAHQQRCPVTSAALAEVDQADIAGLCPNAMYSALEPHTRIPPHHGETNARLVVHLPLIVPGDCLLRVGFETRRWVPGRILAFDDSIEHEARNDSDALRVVLIFDVWNPLLSHGEREVVRALAAATREFAPEI